MPKGGLIDDTFKARCFDAYMELTADGIIAVDRQGYITSINRQYADMLGIHVEDAIGQPIQEIISISEMTKLMENDIVDRNIIRFSNLNIDFSKNNQNKKCKKVSCSNTSSSCAS